MESSQENSSISQNNTEIGEPLEEKDQDSLQAAFTSSSVEIKENTIKKDPINKIKVIIEEIKINIIKRISYKFENRSINNINYLFRVLGRFCRRRFLLGIK